MKFDRKKDPTVCVAREASRYVTGVGVVKHDAKHYLAATDGRCLSMVACELDDGDAPSWQKNGSGVAVTYPLEAFQAARKVKGPVAMSLNGKLTLRTMEGTASEYQAIDCRFPDVMSVVPKTSKANPSICLSVDLLRNIADALCADTVKITFGHNGEGGIDDTVPMLVEPVYGIGENRNRKASKLPDVDGSFGVLMPISSS